MKKLYLCGPINGCSDSEAKDWRNYVKRIWDGKCIDPMRRDYRGEEGSAYKEIVELDKVDVATCDALLVNYEKPSVGTAMEVLFGWQLGKPVVVVCRPETIISPWLRYHSRFITHSFETALSALRDILSQ